ncbi:SRPBCC family protein [Oscillatoria sp. FACHB-1407]|uniref:SRPBCC family protein n=1 Tax=Oscillatoria sp. FACHB-1407 TaxID=2692847 RepID=UPI0016829C78|nr:SRPBCC family protein [Oscillatoria sp. FACHB-1407]MBD2464414.1 SRPBCC family protein [Oscillatoria sp. FACHB-1407]
MNSESMNFDADALNLAEMNVTSADLLESECPVEPPQGVNVKVERLDGRRRQIIATIQIPHPVETVWNILTDYEHLADFIPNLAKSRRIEHPQGGIRLEQVGSQSFFKLKFCARVILDMVEKFPDQLDFRMVEGDFKEFVGSWLLQPQLIGGQPGTELQYVVQILPPRTMPTALIERCLSHTLAMNLTAIQQRTQTLFG